LGTPVTSQLSEPGRYLPSVDVGREAGVQNVVTGIYPKIGCKIVDDIEAMLAECPA
jgi:hypothetical protein